MWVRRQDATGSPAALRDFTLDDEVAARNGQDGAGLE